MSDVLMALPPAVANWRNVHATRRNPLLDELAAITRQLAHADMMTSPEQAELLAFLVETTGAKLVVEVGTFTGYGALAMALALPPDGRLVTLDHTDWHGIAEPFWRRAGVAERIQRRLGLAEDSLDGLLRGPEAGAVDMVYVDADKKRYERYLAQALRLVRPGGLVLLDNLFWGGAVADPNDESRQVAALRRVIQRCRDDDRLAMTLVPVADGLLMLRKR
ncbi:MAG: class I SAM-dependent methyltransferase [Pseudomonadota bacterium]